MVYYIMRVDTLGESLASVADLGGKGGGIRGIPLAGGVHYFHALLVG